MKILSLQPYLSSLDPEATERVTRSLDRTSRGFAQDLVTPLIPNRQQPTSGRLMRIGEVERFLLPTGYSWLDEAENSLKEKIGPYSIMLPFKERKATVMAYFDPKPTRIDREALAYASRKLADLVVSSLHLADIETAYNDMPKGTNLGLPFASASGEYRQAVLDIARFIARGGYNSPVDPCILYWRGQPKGLEALPKQRVVWGYPHYLTLFELQLQIPLLHYLRNRIEFAAWVSTAATDEAITTVLDHASHPVLSVDFSGFDASIPRILIEVVFDVIRSWFVQKAQSLIDFVERWFLDIGLMTPDGIYYDRDGGVPSGSGVTNLIDSLVQLLAFHYIAYRMGNSIDTHLVQGDDGVVAFHNPWDLGQVIEIAKELNLTISDNKGGVSRDQVYYLQNIHSTDLRKSGVCVGVRPLFKVLNGMLSYERFHKKWNSYDDSLRWIQQLETAHQHPAFEKMVKFLYDNDRYAKTYEATQIIKKAGGMEKVESALEIKSFPYGKLSAEEIPKSNVVKELQRLRSEEGKPTSARRR